MRRIITLAALLLALIVPNVCAQPPQSLTYNHYDGQILSQMDTQPGVFNNTGCVWNDEDTWADLGRGDVAADTTIDHTMCLVADYDDSVGNDAYPKVAVFQVYAP